MKQFLRYAGIVLVVVLVLSILVSMLFLLISSHSECNTAGSDYIPCGYWPQFRYFLPGVLISATGAWLVLLPLLGVVTYAIGKRRR